MSRLNMVFDGLIAFVPHKVATERAARADRWLAAFADLRKTFQGTPPAPKLIAPHVPCVIVPDRSVVDVWSDKTPGLVFESRAFSGERYRLYEINEERVTVEYEGKTSLQANVGERTGTPIRDRARELQWVAPLEAMGIEGAGVFDGALVDDQGRPNGSDKYGTRPRGLAGVVVLDSGRLGVDDVIRNRAREAIVFEFRAGETVVHQQAQAGRLALEDTIDGNEAWLQFEGRDGSSRHVKLQAPDGRFDIHVAHLELETILGLGAPTMTGAGRAVDEDFAFHYTLSKGWPFTAALPVPRAKGHIGGIRGTCLPAMFTGLSR